MPSVGRSWRRRNMKYVNSEMNKLVMIDPERWGRGPGGSTDLSHQQLQ